MGHSVDVSWRVGAVWRRRDGSTTLTCCVLACPCWAVLSQSYAEQDALKLIISSLQHLDKVTDDVFNKIKNRVRCTGGGLRRDTVCGRWTGFS